MPAPKGNSNAEKWTIEETKNFLKSVLNYVKLHNDCTSLEEACTELDQYETLIQYLEKKYESIDFKPIKKAKALIKQRLIKKGLNNEYNPTMTIFILKNNHDMKDKQEIDTNTNLTWNETKTYPKE